MNKKYRKINKAEKSKIVEKIKTFLQKKDGIYFAYIFGSMTSEPEGSLIGDIDAAVFVDEEKAGKLKYELSLGADLERLFNFKYNIDLIILNNAPLHFRYEILRQGKILLINKPYIFSDFIESTVKEYKDIKPFREKAIKESLRI